MKQKYIRQLKLKFEMHITDMKIKLLQLRKILLIVNLKIIYLAKYIFIEFWEERV